MSVRRALTGALAAPLLLLAACGGGDSSVADPPVSSATSSPTQAPHRESPEHFIRRWGAAEKRMENTGETAEYLAMSRGCEACKVLARTVRGYYAAGGSVKWGGWVILSTRVNSRQPNGVTFAVRNRSLPTTYRESSTGPLKHLAGGITTELLQLERHAETWNVASKAELAT